MIHIFTDKDLLLQVVGHVLIEGHTYYLNIENYSRQLLESWFEDEYINAAISNYHPKNNILNLKFDNVVGFVNILGIQYEVRSEKFFDGLDGNNQFQALLNEILEISNKLTFSFKGTSYGQRKSEYEVSWNDIEVFDYYYQLVFKFSRVNNLESLVNQCFRHPSTTTVEFTDIVKIEKSNKLSINFFKSIANKSSLGSLDDQHSLANSAFAKFTYNKIRQKLLPLRVINTKLASTTNTVENRFLKFFLEDINSVCLRIISIVDDTEIRTKAKRLQNRIFQFLKNPFFNNIQRLTFIPSSSSVLLSKSGYKEIYYHFVQSRFSFRPILEDQKRQVHRSGLKNIATLYEVWVFFKIALILFEKQKVDETFNGQILKNGSLIGSHTWQGKNCKLFYNKSYSRNSGGSYSVTLRPDISLLIDGVKLFLFDAKYKFNTYNQEDDKLMRFVKREDIHKMHAYLDAIPKSLAAIVIYPGTEIIFYDKNNDDLLNSKILNLRGVGAVPLVPNKSNHYFINLLNIHDDYR